MPDLVHELLATDVASDKLGARGISVDEAAGEFDAVLAHIDRQSVERHAGDQTAGVRILVSVEGDDVQRPERIAQDRGKTPHDVVAALLATPIAQRRRTVLGI